MVVSYVGFLTTISGLFYYDLCFTDEELSYDR